MREELVAAVSAYCTKGWAVFPCLPKGKAPATHRGFKDATKTVREALAAFARVPDANIGVACEASGLVVIDIDPRNGGSLEAFEKLWTSLGLHPDMLHGAPRVTTGGRGMHLYFSGGPCKSREILPGVERKSAGVYVLAPPSVTDAPYTWSANASHAPPPMPKAVMDYEAKQSARSEQRTFKKGERRREAFSILGAARAKGLGEEALLATIRSVNAKQFEPPLEEPELLRMVSNVLKYPGSPPPELVARSFQQICDDPTAMPRALARHLLLENQINMICGAALTGKSMLALDMACSIGSGVPVLGQERFAVQRKHVVTYIYGEQAPALWELRLRAIAANRNLTPELYLVDGAGFTLNKHSHKDELLTFMESVGSDVVFIDPLVVLFPVEDENDAGEVAKAIRGTLQNMVAGGLTPIVVHHASKSSSAKEPQSARELIRGSGDLAAMLGGVVGVWSSGQNQRVKVMTTGRLNASSPFAIRPGDPVSGLGGHSIDIEDLALGEDKVQPPTYDGEWMHAQSQEFIEAVPEGVFGAKEAEEFWGMDTRGARRRIAKLAKGEVLEPRGTRPGPTGPEKLWARRTRGKAATSP